MTLDGTRTYIVGLNRAVVIDPGPAEAAHLDVLARALHGAETVDIVLTHGHPDHAGGARALARRLAAPIRAARGAQQTVVAPADVTGWLDDGQRLETDAGALRVVATPGHTPDHVALFWHDGQAPPRGAVFVGDLLMGEGDTALVAHPEGDLAGYFRSLDRVEALGAAIFYPTHGPPLADPAAALRRYREHRRQRIEQVRGALRTGPARPAELVGRVYGDALHPQLAGAAVASLRAVLEFLVGQGEVAREGEAFRLS